MRTGGLCMFMWWTSGILFNVLGWTYTPYVSICCGLNTYGTRGIAPLLADSFGVQLEGFSSAALPSAPVPVVGTCTFARGLNSTQILSSNWVTASYHLSHWMFLVICNGKSNCVKNGVARVLKKGRNHKKNMGDHPKCSLGLACLWAEWNGSNQYFIWECWPQIPDCNHY